MWRIVASLPTVYEYGTGTRTRMTCNTACRAAVLQNTPTPSPRGRCKQRRRRQKQPPQLTVRSPAGRPTGLAGDMAGGGALGAAAKDAVDEVSLGGDKPRPKISDLARLLWLLLRRSVVVSLGVMLMIVVFGAVWRAVELPHEREVTVDHIETLKRSGEEIAAALADNPRALEWFQAHQAELGKYANSKESCPDPDRPKWDWSGSLYFSFTVVSTIGYGTFGPATDVGKAMVVVLGLVGILLFGLGLGLISAAFDDVLDTVVLYMCSGFSEGRQISPSRRPSLWGSTSSTGRSRP